MSEQPSAEKLIGIGGGVGPMAGVGLHKLVIENTLTDGTDQTHFQVLHASCSPIVLDRTKFLLGEIPDNPGEGMAKAMLAIEAAARVLGKEVVAGVPCNTFHAPKVFERFLQVLKESGSNIQVVHMLNEVADLIEQLAPGAKRIGLMSTTGTRNVGVYNQVLEPRGFDLVEVDPKFQAELHDTIYNKEWGIKAVSPVTPQVRANFERYTRMLIDAGAEAVILGCTEIPLALPEARFDGVPLIDPVLALARALIREANRSKLKPLVAA